MCNRLTVGEAGLILAQNPRIRLTNMCYYKRNSDDSVRGCAIFVRVVQKTGSLQQAMSIMERFIVSGCNSRVEIAAAIGDDLGYLMGLDNGFEGCLMQSRIGSFPRYVDGIDDGAALRRLV